jgi:hypothetical protein
MSNINNRIQGQMRTIIQNADNTHKPQGLDWGVNQLTGTPKPVISDATIDKLAKKFLDTGDKSGMYAIQKTLQEVSERFLAMRTPEGAAASFQVAQANQAFAQALLNKVNEIKRQRSDAAPPAPAGYATV